MFKTFDRICLALAWLSGGIAAFVMAVTFVGVVIVPQGFRAILILD